jgi:hypothetical protein
MRFTYVETHTEETHRGVSYSGKLLWKNREVGTVENKGLGGCDSFQFSAKDYELMFTAEAKKRFPTLAEPLDALVADLWEASLVA